MDVAVDGAIPCLQFPDHVTSSCNHSLFKRLQQNVPTYNNNYMNSAYKACNTFWITLINDVCHSLSEIEANQQLCGTV